MKMIRIAAGCALALLAWACVVTPGKFDAQLTMRKDGTFSYRYVGEINFVAAQSSLGEPVEADEVPFDPEEQMCFDDSEPDEDRLDDVAGTRPCTAEDLATKRREWDSARAERAAHHRRETETLKAMLGGIDPSDPKTMDEFARRLQGYEGWKRVVHKGKGVFDVHYELEGRLDHDFVYPVFPEIDFIIPFVQASRQAGGKVRIVAPAFVQANERAGGSGTMASAIIGAPGRDLFTRAEGNFTVTTDASILTNNTRDGPTAQGASKVLKWVVGPLDTARPEVLLQL